MEKSKRYNKRQLSLLIMSGVYIATGLNHFWHPQFYLNIMPSYIPYPLEMVYISGICEIGFSILLWFSQTRKTASWLIIAMLIVFFTVHVDMIVKTYPAMGMPFWIAVIRFPLQFVLIRWAYRLRDTSFKR